MILAIETTEKFGSAALLNNKTVLAEVALPKDRRSSQTLNAAIAQIFSQTSTKPANVDTVAVVIGPGSFTGLRVGVTAAKVFAYSTGAKIVAVTTFEAVKHSANESIGIDAQRNEVVVSTNNAPATMMSVNEWFKQREYFPGIVFTGPALERYAAKAPPDAVLAAERDWFPKAFIAGQIAAERIERQQFDDVFSLLPIYSRLSAAEERLARDLSETCTE
ncbi:tRNA (adenosine(37)-N6)-threonylcarbamoyltransferase complex dimerization subunit type 1 TsaB [Planctomycetales bacterium]|nr:tRNA (adenosine(37)-N6)-threonylcarbamoyltransferase complex dimerization subunit type 1 TsaB [Planctomycetales bacterium]